MEIRIREVVAELLKNPYIDITYNEIEDGGFELIVRTKNNIGYPKEEEEK